MIRTNHAVQSSAKDYNADTVLGSGVIVAKVMNVVLCIAMQQVPERLQFLMLTEGVFVIRKFYQIEHDNVILPMPLSGENSLLVVRYKVMQIPAAESGGRDVK